MVLNLLFHSMKNKMKKKINVLSISLLGCGAFSALLLLIFRAYHVISFHEIYHVVTSGFEEESLFALWKYFHTLPVYNDPHQLPYSASYFNWLFYSFYGASITAVNQIFHLNESYIPTIGRCLTLVIVSCGFWLNAKLFSNRFEGVASLPWYYSLSLSAILWFGPLVGYWAMTVRPDLLALLFDVCAALFLLKYLSKEVFISAVLAALWCYLSWACKQINIVMPIAIGLFFLIERKWQAFILFSIILVSGYALTLTVANDALLKTLFFVDTAIPLSKLVWIENLIEFMKKTIPVWILIAGLVCLQYRDKSLAQKIRQDKMVKLSLCGLFAWSITLLPASSKIGSSINYYFIALFFLLMAIAGMLRHVVQQNTKLLTGTIALSGVTLMVSILVALTNGSIENLKQQQKMQVSLKTCMDQALQPIFVMNHYAALPWMNPSAISFVLAYNYWNDRLSNRPFEHNGIGGLISQGYFNTLILPPLITHTFDGASLNAYEREGQECGGYGVFTKRKSV